MSVEDERRIKIKRKQTLRKHGRRDKIKEKKKFPGKNKRKEGWRKRKKKGWEPWDGKENVTKLWKKKEGKEKME